MWRWNLAVIVIVLLGVFVMFQIMLGLTSVPSVPVPPEVQSVVDENENEYREQQKLPNESGQDRYLIETAIVPVNIKDRIFLASVARTPDERQQGLSSTSVLPSEVVKLFVFDSNDFWGIWMKDMQYSIDIIWLDKDQSVVHIEENVSPDTYPTVFLPPVPSRYVIELINGMVDELSLELGDTVDFDNPAY